MNSVAGIFSCISHFLEVHVCSTTFSHEVTVPVNTSRTTNYELQGTGWATRAPVAQTLQTVRQTCTCTTATCPYQFARFPSCGIFIPTRTISSENYELKQQGDGAGDTSRTTNYELQGTGWATRAPVAETLQNLYQTFRFSSVTCPYCHVPIHTHLCTCILLLHTFI